MTTMVWINVLLAIPFIALWAGIPLWLVLKRPDTTPRRSAAPAARTAASATSAPSAASVTGRSGPVITERLPV